MKVLLSVLLSKGGIPIATPKPQEVLLDGGPTKLLAFRLDGVPVAELCGQFEFIFGAEGFRVTGKEPFVGRVGQCYRAQEWWVRPSGAR